MDVLKRVKKVIAEFGGVVSVAVRNIENAVDVSVNDDVLFSSASIIKVPMIVEAMRQVKAGRLSLDQEFELSEAQKVRGAGVMRYFHTGTVLTLNDLLTLMIISSDNTATNMVMDVIDIENVNSMLREMGYEKTTLQRNMYDWDAIDAGLDNVCTAAEISDLLVKIATNQAAGNLWDEKIVYILRHQQNSDRLGLFLPGDIKLANKTGSRDSIVHDVGIVTTEDFSYAISVLTKDVRGGPGQGQIAIATISKIVFDYILSL